MRILSFVLALTLTVSTAMAHSSGRPGSTVTGCKTCHANTAASQATLSLKIDTLVPAGRTVPVAVTVHAPDNINFRFAGYDLRIETLAQSSAGVLIPETDSHVSGNEVMQKEKKALVGGKTTWNVKWTAPESQGTYRVRLAGLAANGNSQNTLDHSVLMEPILIRVGPSAGLTIGAVPAVVCRTEPVTLTWTNRSLSWLRLDIQPEGGPWYTIEDSISAFDGSLDWTFPATRALGRYKVRLMDHADTTLTSESTTFTLQAAPIITTQPQSETISVGGEVRLKVVATGGNLSYKWFKNDEEVAGATTDELVLSSITLAGAGTYRAEVSNGCGMVASSNAVVAVVGAVLGASADTLDFEGIETGAPKSMSFDITNTGTAGLTVNLMRLEGPGMSQFAFNPPAPLTIAAGATATITVTALGNNPGTYAASLYMAGNNQNDRVHLKVTVTDPVNGVEEDEAVALLWPNPAGEYVDVRLENGSTAEVVDLQGRHVITLGAGRWDLRDERGSRVPAGRYLVRAGDRAVPLVIP